MGFFYHISSLVFLFLLSPCSFFSSILATQNTSGYLCLLFLCHQKSHTVTTLTPFMSQSKGLFWRSHLHSLPEKKKKKKKTNKNTLIQHSLNLLNLTHFFQNIHNFNIVYIFIYTLFNVSLSIIESQFQKIRDFCIQILYMNVFLYLS